MKHMKLAIIITILSLLIITAGTAFAGGIAITGTIDTLTCSADATELTVDYTITGHTSENLDIRNTLIGLIYLPGQNGVQQLIINLPFVLQDGVSYDIDLGYGSTSLDSKTITCTPLIPEIIEQPLETDEPFIPPRFNDGRLEPFASDYVVFPDPNLGIVVYTPDGNLVLFVPLASIDMLGIPNDNPRLLGESEDGQAKVFRLNDGRYQVVLGADAEGKFHTAIWSGLGNISPDNIETDTF